MMRIVPDARVAQNFGSAAEEFELGPTVKVAKAVGPRLYFRRTL